MGFRGGGGSNCPPPQHILVFKYPSRDRVKLLYIRLQSLESSCQDPVVEHASGALVPGRHGYGEHNRTLNIQDTWMCYTVYPPNQQNCFGEIRVWGVAPKGPKITHLVTKVGYTAVYFVHPCRGILSMTKVPQVVIPELGTLEWITFNPNYLFRISTVETFNFSP